LYMLSLPANARIQPIQSRDRKVATRRARKNLRSAQTLYIIFISHRVRSALNELMIFLCLITRTDRKPCQAICTNRHIAFHFDATT
jgi:hypothetical protein